jgi:hypothetical protein
VVVEQVEQLRKKLLYQLQMVHPIRLLLEVVEQLMVRPVEQAGFPAFQQFMQKAELRVQLQQMEQLRQVQVVLQPIP